MGVDQKTLALDSRRISIQLELLTDKMIAQQGLSTAQAHVLLYILHHSDAGTSLTEMHREFGYSMASLSCILKRLRKNGYVRAEPCPDDDRRKILFGTEKSAQLEECVARAICSACSLAYCGFSQSELRALDQLQKKIIHNLSAPAGDPPKSKRSDECEKSSAAAQAV